MALNSHPSTHSEFTPIVSEFTPDGPEFIHLVALLSKAQHEPHHFTLVSLNSHPTALNSHLLALNSPTFLVLPLIIITGGGFTSNGTAFTPIDPKFTPKGPQFTHLVGLLAKAERGEGPRHESHFPCAPSDLLVVAFAFAFWRFSTFGSGGAWLKSRQNYLRVWGLKG
jgi:hypothetical protein